MAAKLGMGMEKEFREHTSRVPSSYQDEDFSGNERLPWGAEIKNGGDGGVTTEFMVQCIVNYAIRLVLL